MKPVEMWNDISFPLSRGKKNYSFSQGCFF